MLDRAPLHKLIDAEHSDPDKSRRAHTLNIILAAVFVISILGFMFALEAYLRVMPSSDETRVVLLVTAALTIATILMYFLNRIRPVMASVFFLILLTTLLSFGDTPIQIAAGRSLLFMALPVIIASVVLPSWCTFIFAGLVSLVVNLISLSIGIPFAPFSAFAFFIIALISYLGASQLEHALGRLRRINEELDERVEERTRELLDANRQLADANDRLRELDRLKSRFLSMVSHELRTPLSAIQGFTEILLAEIYGPITSGQRNALNRVTSNATRLLNLVGDLLDRARIEAGQLVLHYSPFSPLELVEDVESTLGLLAQSKGLSLTAFVAPDLPPLIHGDEARLRQILVNLVNNSIKFTEKGGVSLHLAKQEGNGTGQRPAWVIAISDTGLGIAEKDQLAVFEPFHRVDDSSTRTEMGVGLGLSIVKNLVELMEGSINLQSRLGEGSTFTITLPLLANEEGTHE
jgi:signal transduction histidine kinase